MILNKWLTLVVLLILLGEGALQALTRIPIPQSTAPVFFFPAELGTPADDAGLAAAVLGYGADSGERREFPTEGGVTMSTMFFTWERAEMGPILEISRHAPEVCNVAAGFTFIGHHPLRSHRFPGGEQLQFDVTEFKTPTGIVTYVFKTAWMQGIGTLSIQRGEDRLARLQGAFRRHAGAARVLQGGVFAATDEETAWTIFRAEVLDHLIWTAAAQSGT
jgi:hypothetical protein